MEEVAERQRPENRGEKNEPGKYGQDKVIRQGSRDLQRMVAHHVAVSRAESLLDTADAHSLTMLLNGRRVNTEMTVYQEAGVFGLPLLRHTQVDGPKCVFTKAGLVVSIPLAAARTRRARVWRCGETFREN